MEKLVIVKRTAVVISSVLLFADFFTQRKTMPAALLILSVFLIIKQKEYHDAKDKTMQRLFAFAVCVALISAFIIKFIGD